MWKSIIYKEWLKVRWYLIAATLLLGIFVSYMFINVQHTIAFMQANNYWNVIVFRKEQYFHLIKYLPLLIGIGIAIAQYVPEIIQKRIKLSFHLPNNENKIILTMMGFGNLSLLACFSIVFLIFVGLSNYFFPYEIVNEAIVTILPWFIGGLAGYSLVSLIVLEPIWKYKMFYMVVAALFIPIYYESGVSGAFEPINFKLTIIALLISVSLLFSAYRFRKGEM
ncbi:MAG: hypothetical protein IMY72_06540 [Bacteroidetes bacterium]|nr:hypothetical protein [Bacteroidota bacterium]